MPDGSSSCSKDLGHTLLDFHAWIKAAESATALPLAAYIDLEYSSA